MNQTVKRAMIYPYGRESVALVMNLDSMENGLKVTHLVIPKSYGRVGQDGGEIFNLHKVGYPVCSDFVDCLKTTDVVVIVDNNHLKFMIDKVEQNIRFALENEKQVICCVEMSNNFLDSVHNYIESKQFVYLPYKKENDQDYKQAVVASELSQPNVPIVFIGALMSDINSSDVLIFITQQFREMGYKVVAISDKGYSSLLNLYQMPSYMENNKYKDDEKVFMLNHFINNIVNKEKPDILFVELSEPIMKYNDKFTNGFGVVPYLISQAVQADSMVLCTQYDTVNSEFFENINLNCKYRFGVELGCIAMSNYMLSIQDSLQDGRLTYLQVKHDLVNQTIDDNYLNNRLQVYNYFDKKAVNRMCEKLIAILTGESDMDHC